MLLPSTSSSRAVCGRLVQSVATASSSSSVIARRTYFVSPARCAAAPLKKTAAKTEAAPPAHIPSSCTPGTVLTGLAILKDAPEVIAKPDEEYPSWLWELANEPAMKTTFASTDAAEVIASESGSSSAFPATKGALRAKEKRAMKAKRAAQAAEDRAQAKAARIAKAAKGAEVPKAQQKAAEGRDPIEVERETQRALRKANRDRIRTNNFIQSS